MNATPTPTPLPPSLFSTAFRWVRETLIRRRGSESGRRAWWRRRSIRAVIATLVMAAGFWAVGGSDLAYAGACSSDQTLPTPDYVGATTENPHLVSLGTSVQGRVLRSAASSVTETYPVGVGMHFTGFGLTMCGDLPHQASLQNANLVQDIVLQMLSGMGIALDWLLSGHISAFLLDLLGSVSTAMSANIWLAYAPALITVTLLGIALKVARGRGNPWSDLAWVILVTVLAGALTTPVGWGLARQASDATGDLARAVAMAPAGLKGGPDSTVSAALIDSLVADTWSAGVLGDLANQPMPAEVVMRTPSSVPDVTDAWTIRLNFAAIPAKTPGAPTWGETWRWTSAYTASEVAYMRDHPEARCKVSGASPVTSVISSLSQDQLDTASFCYAKWATRTAMLSTLKADEPAAYERARGATGDNFKSALAELGAMPTMVGLMIMSSLALIAEAEFGVLMLGAVLACLASLRSPTVLKRWTSQIAAALVRRVAIAFVVGVAVIILGQLSAFLAATWKVSPWLSTSLLPITESLIGFVLLIGAYKALKGVGSALSASVGVAEATEDGPVTKGARRIGLAAVSAAAGAVGAAGGGAGAMLQGAAAGMGRSAVSKRGSSTVGGAVTSGAAGGRRVAHEKRVEAALAARTSDQDNAGKAARDDATESYRARTEAAWDKVMDTPELDAARAPAYEAAAGELDAAERRLADAQAELARAIEAASRRASERAAALVAEGVDPERARARAWDEGERDLAPARATVRRAEAGHQAAIEGLDRAWRGEGTELAEKVRAALDAGQAVERVVYTFGLDQTTRDALQEYVQEHHAASELFYRGRE